MAELEAVFVLILGLALGVIVFAGLLDLGLSLPRLPHPHLPGRLPGLSRLRRLIDGLQGAVRRGWESLRG